jgi:hypothetical protein
MNRKFNEFNARFYKYIQTSYCVKRSSKPTPSALIFIIIWYFVTPVLVFYIIIMRSLIMHFNELVRRLNGNRKEKWVFKEE